MTFFIVTWLVFGLLISLYRISQVRKYRPNGETAQNDIISMAVLPILISGVLFWPILLLKVYIDYKNLPSIRRDSMSDLSSLTCDLKPDRWVSFYLFYFNLGLGSDASFQLGNRLVHMFAGQLMSKESSAAIIESVGKKHELAVGEFMEILTNLTDEDLNQLKSSAGAALIIENQSWNAESTIFTNKEDIKSYTTILRSQGFEQLH